MPSAKFSSMECRYFQSEMSEHNEDRGHMNVIYPALHPVYICVRINAVKLFFP